MGGSEKPAISPKKAPGKDYSLPPRIISPQPASPQAAFQSAASWDAWGLNTVRIKHILNFLAGLCGYELPLSGSIEPHARPDLRALSERY